MPSVYLSLGSNLGDRAAYLRQALSDLKKLGAIIRTSSIYETEPVGLKDQPWFLNLVVSLETKLAPQSLLNQTQAIERSLGRARTVPNGPRTIDIDILFYDDIILSPPSLTIPHSRLHERRFVLAPLAELAAGLLHPRLQKSIQTLLKECLDMSQVRAYSAPRLIQ